MGTKKVEKIVVNTRKSVSWRRNFGAGRGRGPYRPFFFPFSSFPFGHWQSCTAKPASDYLRIVNGLRSGTGSGLPRKDAELILDQKLPFCSALDKKMKKEANEVSFQVPAMRYHILLSASATIAISNQQPANHRHESQHKQSQPRTQPAPRSLRYGRHRVPQPLATTAEGNRCRATRPSQRQNPKTDQGRDTPTRGGEKGTATETPTT